MRDIVNSGYWIAFDAPVRSRRLTVHHDCRLPLCRHSIMMHLWTQDVALALRCVQPALPAESR
jgi:hypothetical protein